MKTKLPFSRTKAVGGTAVGLAAAQTLGLADVSQATFADPSGASWVAAIIGFGLWFLRSPIADLMARNNEMSEELKAIRETLNQLRDTPNENRS